MPVYLSAWTLLNEIEKSLLELLQKTPAKGLNAIQVYVLEELYAHDHQRASDLATAVSRASTAFTPVLDSLVDLQLVRRSAHPTDRRSVQISLTVKGKALREPIEAVLKTLDANFPECDWRPNVELVADAGIGGAKA